MSTVLLILEIFVTIALIGVVLIQRSEGGGLGIGSSQGMGSFMSGRGTANFLTRATAVLATAFMGLALALALINHGTSGVGAGSILGPLPPGPASPASTLPARPGGGVAVPTAPVPAAPAPKAPATPSKPSVPTN